VIVLIRLAELLRNQPIRYLQQVNKRGRSAKDDRPSPLKPKGKTIVNKLFAIFEFVVVGNIMPLRLSFF